MFLQNIVWGHYQHLLSCLCFTNKFIFTGGESTLLHILVYALACSICKNAICEGFPNCTLGKNGFFLFGQTKKNNPAKAL